MTVLEPTDDGYLKGFDLELRNDDGSREHRLVFIEETPTVPLSSAPVWVFPNDPALPALKTLVDPVSTELELARLGVETSAPSSQLVTYRPGRRAVLRIPTSRASIYVKVVAPGKAAAIAERHDQFRSATLPVPRLLGWSHDGVVVLSELPGVDAQAAVGAMKDHELFLDQLEFLSTLLADVPAIRTARASLFDRLDWYVERLSAHLPGDSARIASLGDAIARWGAYGRGFEHTPVTIHGDLHLGQLFVDPVNPCLISGMLDIDTSGSGDPADDAAAFYAHLIALGETARVVDAVYTAACLALAAAWLARWRRNRNAGFEARCRAIAATHLLGHSLRPMGSDGDAVSTRLLDHAAALVAGAP